MKIKFKKLVAHAFKPTQGYLGDAAWDLYAVSYYRDPSYKFIEYDTSLAVEIPKGFVGLVFPRSSISNYSLDLCNSVAVIDSNFRGTIKLRFRYGDENQDEKEYMFGDRIGQILIIPYPNVEWEETNALSKTSRGDHGFGSSKRNKN